MDKVGTGYTLRRAPARSSATSTGFDVAAGPAARLVFRTPPANAAAGAALGPVEVEIQDAAGNLDTGSTAHGVAQPGRPLAAARSAAPPRWRPSAAWPPSQPLHRSGGDGLHADGERRRPDRTSPAAPSTSLRARPTQLAFTVQPGNVVAGAAFAPAVKVAIQDAFGNLVTERDPGSITLALATNPQGATLARHHDGGGRQRRGHLLGPGRRPGGHRLHADRDARARSRPRRARRSTSSPGGATRAGVQAGARQHHGGRAAWAPSRWRSRTPTATW